MSDIGQYRLLCLSVVALENMLHPFDVNFWPLIKRPIKKNEILLASSLHYLIKPIGCWSANDYPRWKHVRRCAWFLENDDKKHPIVFNFNSGKWPIEDGNHRFLASCARGDKSIIALCCNDLKSLKRLGVLQNE